LDEEQQTAFVCVTGFQQHEVVTIHENFQKVDSDRANRKTSERKQQSGFRDWGMGFR
jgi:hypothetical protein